MTTATPAAGRAARLWAALLAWLSPARPVSQRAAAARTEPAARMPVVEAAQLAAELAGMAAFVVAGFLVSAVLGFVVLGLVLLVVGNVRWR